MKKIVSLLIVAVIMSVTFTGCKKKKGNPPVLPPFESMAIDFSDFGSAKKSAGAVFGAKDVPDPDENYMFSSTMAGVWNVILTVNLVVPVTAFKLAINNTPVWIADKTWEWKYSVTGVTGTYKARLVGIIQSDKVKWEMFITREGTGAFAEFLWFDGTTALDGNSGVWNLNHSQQFQEPYIKIEWSKTATTIGSVKYTYVRTQTDARATDTFKNSYIQYGLTTGSLNAFYTMHLFESTVINDFVDIFIEWNTTAGNGRVKAFYKFGDNNWHCWDTDKNNIVCPT
jgi:hypothetical protein